MIALLKLLACPSTPQDSTPETGCDPQGEDTGIQVGTIDEACRCTDPVLEIGTGVTAFETVAPDSCLEMVHGPQGGWHLPSALRVQNTGRRAGAETWRRAAGRGGLRLCLPRVPRLRRVGVACLRLGGRRGRLRYGVPPA